jgi:predicted transposase YbfD/YdcC
MEAQATAERFCAPSADGFLRYFQDMPDPRDCNTVHQLSDMLVIAVLAVICGADGWVDVEFFGKAKHRWLATFLDLPGGIPSHDTFGRLFARLDPEAFERGFVAWMSALVQGTGGRLVAIDGKALRRSFEQAWDKSGMAHLVSAFAGANQLVFGQLAVEDKSNEILAIPKLLELLDLKGAVVTIDALGCQKEIAGRIVQKQAGYVLAVKENQPALYAKVTALLDEALLEGFGGMPHDYFEQTNGGHGRIETRQVWCTREVHWLGKLVQEWPGLQSLAVVESKRQVIGQEPKIERRYYISTLDGQDAEVMAGAIRGHWGIENQLHWSLDVTFGEDQSRIRKDHGAENFSRLRRIALNLLQKEKTTKASIRGKRKLAGWDHGYLLKLLGN